MTPAPSHIPFHDAGYGHDVFGLNPRWIEPSFRIFNFLYKYWFRVTSHDSTNIPKEGATILAANHSGTLPFDGVMIYMDVYYHTDPIRIPRVTVDHFVPMLPFVGNYFARMGVIGGSRGNVRHLLQHGELLVIFPEGVPGVGKRFKDRYKLQSWREGHAELAIRYRALVVPVAVIGAEEQMPQIARLPIKMFGSPYLPIPLTLFPLPVHYHIYYGEPIDFSRYAPEESDYPKLVQSAALEVQAAVQKLIERGLKERTNIFR